jgi:WD40 repeat protein
MQDDRRIFCWDVCTENLVSELVEHIGVVKDIDYCKGGEVLCSSSFDKTVKIWRVKKE